MAKPRHLEPSPGVRVLPSREPSTGLEQFAWLMDRAIRIPGTNMTVGLDALLGLLPVGGDVVSGLLQAGMVAVALGRYKVPKAVAARMAANVLLDLSVGAIPIAGDIFDIFFKANTRNLGLLKQVQQHHDRGEPMPTRSSVWYLVFLVAALGAVLVLAVVGLVALIVWVSKLTNQSL